MSENIDDFNCENCGEYCGDKSRLNVLLPEELQKKLGKEKAKLCDACVKAHCVETISPFWKKFYFPRLKVKDATV